MRKPYLSVVRVAKLEGIHAHIHTLIRTHTRSQGLLLSTLDAEFSERSFLSFILIGLYSQSIDLRPVRDFSVRTSSFLSEDSFLSGALQNFLLPSVGSHLSCFEFLENFYNGKSL